MKKSGLRRKVAATAVLTSVALGACAQSQTQSTDVLLNLLLKKGVLTEEEAKSVKAELAAQTNTVSASKWKLSSAIKEITLFGDMRFRYEYRGAETTGDNVGYRERFRYSVRFGLRGDLYDNWYYGLRLETSANPRSTWVTMADEKTYPYPGPSSKTSDGINVGQAYLGWRPTDWADITVGRMPNPMYTTPLLWDGDINPEGAAERFKFTTGPVDLFFNFGQFLYTDTDPDQSIVYYPKGATVPTPVLGSIPGNQSDAFLLAWQVGANVHMNKDMAFKIGPALYNYTGYGQYAGFPGPFVGQGNALGVPGLNVYDPAVPGYINQSGINNLFIFDLPWEFNFKIGSQKARFFGDFAMNLDSSERAKAAAKAGGMSQAYPDENKAYQFGFGVGNLGLVYGSTSKKNTWEVRTYWQHIEQYAVDVNLIDSDFFEGRANLEGIYVAFAYSFTDSIIGTVRYGYAQRINKNLGTGGSNQDLPQINPIGYYNLVQLDLTWRF
jgi:hypothetical protein